MPKYEFECQHCNVRFERTLKMGDHPTHPCPKCSEAAPRLLSDFGFGFAPGKTPGNSGVHDQDYPTADKAVGRSADSRWKEVAARDKVKEQARKEGGTPALIRKDGEAHIDYEPMSEQGLQAHREIVKQVREVMARPAVGVQK